MTEEEKQVSILPIQVAAMIDATNSKKTISKVCQAVSLVNFRVDDDLFCKADSYEVAEYEWEYSLRFTLTHYDDIDVAEKLVCFFTEVSTFLKNCKLRHIDVDLLRFKSKSLTNDAPHE